MSFTSVFAKLSCSLSQYVCIQVGTLKSELADSRMQGQENSHFKFVDSKDLVFAIGNCTVITAKLNACSSIDAFLGLSAFEPVFDQCSFSRST